MNIRVVLTEGWDVWKNLAIEEYMVRNVKDDEVILYLWQSEKNVMLGKNQNPWRECNAKLLETEGGKLSRRITGGGAIYSDHGNMLFSFIMPKKYYDVERQLSVILKSCEKIGISAYKSGRNDLTVAGKKFSGNAFFYNNSVGLHHGSLLIKEDVENLVRYLTPSIDKISSKGILSVRSRVTNLSEHNNWITMDNFKDIIIETFIETYKKDGDEVITERDPSWFRLDDIEVIYNRNKSWEWCYGKTAESDLILETRFDWGEVQLHVKLKQSKIESITIYSDALDQQYIEEMSPILIGCRFKSDVLADEFKAYGNTKERLEKSKNIGEWLLSKAF